MTHDIRIVGDGPAATAAAAAFDDIDATLTAADSPALTVVVVPAGSGVDALNADHGCVALVEIGGVGGHPVADLDAAVSIFGSEGPRFADLRQRVAATTDADGSPSGDRSAVRFAGAVAGRRAVALLSGDVSVAGTVVEVAGTGVAAERRLLPVPTPEDRDRTVRRDHRDVDVDDALTRAERALDERIGPIEQVGERESFPVPYYLAGVADTKGFSDARAAAFAAGADRDWDRAFMKALGEGLERYCAGVYRRSEFTVAPERTRSNPIPPSRFVRPDGWTLPDSDTPIPWVRGTDLTTDESASLPAAFVHYPPPTEEYKPAITTGLGLGNAGVEALLSGLYETIERDATMLAWYSSFEPLELDVSDESYDALRQRARAEGLSVTTLLVTQDVDVPVVAVAVHRDGEWPRFAAGSAASLAPDAAARSALSEALQNWMELRSMGPEAAASESGAISDHATDPTPAADFLDAGAAVPADSVGPASLPTGTAELDAVLDRVTDAGLNAYAARTTTRDVASLGFEAVRVLVPEAQPLFQGDPFFGDRARTVPAELGFDPDLDRPYHPFP
ncbi:bacteriocin biosynthesis protein SagD [Halobellus salinus]|uniref:Bacteriocin biosynthesis protein SagD n=1 Tax=Halobellus salinus TaxID=931585 RepID=A0A830ET15_9EURY|nr:YcaO-like family protein [Halobellus salinus]GGJ06896.1 bacteriocin biosynthesis protein SagD [Halobellus salinus]SMP15310.1 ribosomal protein S12 methylthiotransferase accessory factor [Halobellus salinus]